MSLSDEERRIPSQPCRKVGFLNVAMLQMAGVRCGL